MQDNPNALRVMTFERMLERASNAYVEAMRDKEQRTLLRAFVRELHSRIPPLHDHPAGMHPVPAPGFRFSAGLALNRW